MKVFIILASHLRKIYWFLIRPKTRGVKAIILKDNAVLLVKNSYDDFLCLPGGGVKKNEKPKKAIIRELKEEVGVVPQKPTLIGKFTNNREHKKDTIYLYLITDFTKTHKTNFEIESEDFYPLDALPVKVSKATKKRLAGLSNSYTEGDW